MTSSVTSLRWYLKKTARAGMVFTSWGSGYLALSAATAAGPRLRVLTYHRFGDLPRDPFCVSVPDFAAQMAFLAEHRLAVGVAELEAFLAGRAPVPDGAVLVTIDDGFRSTLTDAMPVLRDHGVPAIAFITPTKLGRAPGDGGEDDDLPEPFMTWDELDRLAARTAQICGADVLILLSDVDGLYTDDPAKPGADHVPEIYSITPEIEAMAGPARTRGAGTGGMASKIAAAKIAAASGWYCPA